MFFGHPTTDRHCKDCSGFGEWREAHVWCAKYQLLKAMPERGCSGWSREPGSDDEPDNEKRPQPFG